MSDYRVSVKIRNARILRAIEDAGHEPGPTLARAAGISVTAYYDLVNLRMSPWAVTKRRGRTPGGEEIEGTLSETVIKFAAFLGVDPWALFSLEQYKPLEKNTADFEMTGSQVAALIESEQDRLALPAPDTEAERKEETAIVRAMLKTLAPREREVIAMRYGIGGSGTSTLEETAAAMGVSRERIRQIEAKALRKLRHPNRSNVLLECLRYETVTRTTEDGKHTYTDTNILE